MDIDMEKQRLFSFFKKYQYILLLILIGILLMVLPGKTEEPQIQAQPAEIVLPDLEKELSVILSKIAGVGKAEVLLTEQSGSNTFYQMDNSQSQANLSTVIVTDENRNEAGLIRQVIPPVYKGAIIVCQGADSAKVRLAVVDAVGSVTGLSSDCITVLKMK